MAAFRKPGAVSAKEGWAERNRVSVVLARRLELLCIFSNESVRKKARTREKEG